MLWARPAPDSLAQTPRPVMLKSGAPNPRPRRLIGMQIRTKPQPQRLATALFADAQLLNDGFVALGIGLSEVVEQAATLADHHEKAAPGGVVLLVGLEMLRQFANPGAQDGDLNFR